MSFVEKNQLKWIILIFIILVFYSHGFNMLGWDLFVPSPYYLVASLFLIMLALMSYKVAKKKVKLILNMLRFFVFGHLYHYYGLHYLGELTFIMKVGMF